MNKKNTITTHVLDTALGRPAQGILIELTRRESGEWKKLGQGTTNEDGRVSDLLKEALTEGTYRLIFHTGEYHHNKGFYPKIPIVFEVENADQHYHVPLLLNPYGYSTYRGS